MGGKNYAHFIPIFVQKNKKTIKNVMVPRADTYEHNRAKFNFCNQSLTLK